MTVWLTDMAKALRDGGCRVVEVDGWQTRSYPGWSPGFEQKPSHVMVHHTASAGHTQNDIAYMLRGAPNPTPGRPNLAPIGNLYLARDGVYHVIAAGRATTNGTGSSRPWNGGVPDDMMNHHAIAIEAANDGVGMVWPKEQCDAYARGVAALCLHYGIEVAHVRAHAEWAPGRKIDPAGPTPSHSTWGGTSGRVTWRMDEFRADVLREMAAMQHPPTPQPPTPPPSRPIVVEDATMNVMNPPTRLLDTRTTHNPWKSNEARQVSLPSAQRSAKAALVCVAAVTPSGDGYMAAWGAGPKPNASFLNFGKHTIQGTVLVPVVGGKFTLWTSLGVHVVVDLQAVWP